MGPEFANPRGFVCSTEFKLLYQWHSLIPEWGMAAVLQSTSAVTDVDAELERMISTAAGRFGPLHCPKMLVPAEVNTMQLARDVGLGTYNDFRVKVGWSAGKVTSWDGFSPRPEIQAALKEAYATPDDVELYVGMLCAEPSAAKAVLSFSAEDFIGFCILSDAMCAVRADRFYTKDFTKAVYTAWGLEHAKTTGLGQLLGRHTGLPPLDSSVDFSKVQALGHAAVQ
jgi:hypothetical protein